jgi:hypothetical protein
VQIPVLIVPQDRIRQQGSLVAHSALRVNISVVPVQLLALIVLLDTFHLRELRAVFPVLPEPILQVEHRVVRIVLLVNMFL